jgi:hypothetical protein
MTNRSQTKELYLFAEDDTWMKFELRADYEFFITYIPDTLVETEETELPFLSREDAKKLRDFLIYALA